MKKETEIANEVTLSPAPEEGRRPTVGAGDNVKRPRFWAKHKTEAVMRLLRGETLELLSRELGVTAAELSSWREAFLAAGSQALAKPNTQNEAEVKRLNAKIGELTMANELLYEKIDRLEQNRPLAFRRPKK